MTTRTEPQSIDAPLSVAAAFLVLQVKDDAASLATVRSGDERRAVVRGLPGPWRRH